ncbi:MAG: hypothetical protein J6Y82_02840 [Bacteroidales bacterium]|nr:hypothetical protein [Bacteroidales bacterium]
MENTENTENTENQDINTEKLHVSVLGFSKFADANYQLECVVKSGVLHDDEDIVFNVGATTTVENIFSKSYESLKEARKGQKIKVIIGPDVSATDLEKCVSFRKNESVTTKTDIQKKISLLEGSLSLYRQSYPLSIADTFIGNSRKYIVIFIIFMILLAVAYPSFSHIMAAVFGTLALAFFTLMVGDSKSLSSTKRLFAICDKISSLGEYPDVKNYIAKTEEDIKNEEKTKQRRYTIGKVFLVLYCVLLAAYVGYTFVKHNDLMRSEWENVHVDENLHGDLNLTAELLDLKPREPFIVLKPLEQEAGAEDIAIFLVESDIHYTTTSTYTNSRGDEEETTENHTSKLVAFKFKTPKIDRIARLVITDQDGRESNLVIPTRDDVSKVIVQGVDHDMLGNNDYMKKYSSEVLNTLYYLKKHQNELRYKIVKD